MNKENLGRPTAEEIQNLYMDLRRQCLYELSNSILSIEDYRSILDFIEKAKNREWQREFDKATLFYGTGELP